MIQRYKHIFYSVIGKHAEESIESILSRKREEINACGYTLWSARIDKKSVDAVWNIPHNSKVAVLCHVSQIARDPIIVEGSKPYCASTLIGPDGETRPVPDGIRTTFTRGANYQAYVVKDIKVLNKTIDYDFQGYESTLATGEKRTFKERFEGFNRFQNTYGVYNKELAGACSKEISVVMLLQYPFVVNIK